MVSTFFTSALKLVITYIFYRAFADLENTKFVFVAFNYFTKALTTDVYVPAEFSASEYSFNEGIMSVYSTLIDPGQIIFGQGSDAQHHSSTTHNLPLPPNALGEKNMGKLYSNILEYLSKIQEGKDSNKPLVVFTKTDMVPVVKSCFRYLACESHDGSYDIGDQIQVLDIQYLLFILKKEVLDIAGVSDDKINLYVTDAYFLKDFFEFTPEIACQVSYTIYIKTLINFLCYIITVSWRKWPLKILHAEPCDAMGL